MRIYLQNILEEGLLCYRKSMESLLIGMTIDISIVDSPSIQGIVDVQVNLSRNRDGEGTCVCMVRGIQILHCMHALESGARDNEFLNSSSRDSSISLTIMPHADPSNLASPIFWALFLYLPLYL